MFLVFGFWFLVPERGLASNSTSQTRNHEPETYSELRTQNFLFTP